MPCKVRQVAVANETPFGVTRYCEHAIWDGLPKIACVQQEYNILTQNKVEMGELLLSRAGYGHQGLRDDLQWLSSE